MNIQEKQNYIKSNLKSLRQQLKDINNELSHMIKLCKHEDLDINEYGSAKCNICGKSFRWYCPTSPTLTCDYEFINGDSEEDSNEDDCIYCHQPEERK